MLNAPENLPETVDKGTEHIRKHAILCRTLTGKEKLVIDHDDELYEDTAGTQ
jgi:hypothetical protein